MPSTDTEASPSSPDDLTILERLNHALPPFAEPADRQLKPSEKSNVYYERLEPFRRVCEARAVLRWIAEGHFYSAEHLAAGCRRAEHSVGCYVTEVANKRGDKAASVLIKDVLDLYREVIEHSPSLQYSLQSPIKLLK